MKKPTKTTKVRPDPKIRRRLFWAGLGVVILIGGVFFSVYRWTPSFRLPKHTLPAIAKTDGPLHPTLDELANLPPEKLDQIDIAEMNLLCAQELPGSEKLNVADSLVLLDGWAKRIAETTKVNEHWFQERPAYYDNSHAVYKMVQLVLTLQHDLHVRYNPKFMELPGQRKEPDSVFLATSKNVFLNGLLDYDRMGTCASLPVLYVSIGRRLGYPLYLALAKGHVFVIWDDGKERLNFEGSASGMNVETDAHFMQWPEPISQEELNEDEFLHPFNGAEMLSLFLQNRGNVLVFANRRPLAVNCYLRATELTPRWSDVKATLAFFSWPDAMPPRTESNSTFWDMEQSRRESEFYKEIHGMILHIPESARGLVKDPTPTIPFPLPPIPAFPDIPNPSTQPARITDPRQLVPDPFAGLPIPRPPHY